MNKQTRQNEKQLPKKLREKSQLGPYPMEKLKQVDEPTTKIVGEIERFDESNTGFSKAFRGDYGDTIGGMGFGYLEKSIMSYFFNQGEGKSGFSGNSFDKSMDPEKIAKMKAMFSSGGGSPMKSFPPDMQIGKGSPQELHPDLAVVSRHIKSYGYFMGADVMGICRVPDYAYYSHDKDGNPVEKKYEYAILIVVDQDYDTMKGSSGRDWISGAQSLGAYSKSAFIAAALARYIQFLGHEAKDNNSRDYQVVVPPLLLLAGIGEIARNGIVLNPYLGMRFKAALVLTNMPMEVDKPIDFGLEDFCKKCKKCATCCPPKAISPDDDLIIHNGYERYTFNVDSCTKFRLSNPNGSSCGTCIKVCPFNKPRGILHDIVRWMIQYMPFMNDSIVKADDLLRYGEANYDDQWWFDPEIKPKKEKSFDTKGN